MRGLNNFTGRFRSREQRSLTERQFQAFTKELSEDTMTNPNAIYAKFEDLEEQLAHCYFTLHERFAANPELAAFWTDAAWEEMQHCSILRYCREQGLRADATVNINTANHVGELLATVKRVVRNPGVTVDEAFNVSLLMESSELDDAYEKLTRPLASHHRALFEAIHASMRSHHDKFADGATEFSANKAYAEAFRAFARADKRVWERTAP
jgi:hypothetical protein